MTDPDLEATWAEVPCQHARRLERRQADEHPERGQWAKFAFDTTETPVEGKRSR